MKKTSGYVIILHICTKNHCHMMHASWDMKHDRQVFCHFGSFFTLYWPQKSKFGKNEENAQIYYYHLTHLYHKWKSYDVCFFRYGMQQTEFLSFWAIFCLFTPLTIQKIKIFQIQKRHLKISWFYTSVPKTMIICYTFLDMWHVRDVIIIFQFLPFYTPYSSKN